MLSKGLSRIFSDTTVQKHQFFGAQLSHAYVTARKTTTLTRWTFVGKVIALLFNMLSRLVIAFLPRRKHLDFMAAVTICSDLGAKEIKEIKEIKSVSVSIVSPSICHEVMGLDAVIFVFCVLEF